MKNIRTKTLLTATIIGLSGLGLGACALDAEPTKVTQERVILEEKSYIQQIDADLLTDEYLVGVANHFRKHGTGKIDLMMGYDPESLENTALSAADEAAKLVGKLNSEGVRNIEPSVLPIKNLGDKSRVILSYRYVDAEVPENCDMMPGMKKGDEIVVDPTYELGCTIEHVFAKQIARPNDLMGKEWENEYSDGRRTSNVVERYRTGVPNEALQGEQASDN
ncbi:MAG: CpaD family pilus assembly lipoprotein [Pseudomonadota bacterium]